MLEKLKFFDIPEHESMKDVSEFCVDSLNKIDSPRDTSSALTSCLPIKNPMFFGIVAVSKDPVEAILKGEMAGEIL